MSTTPAPRPSVATEPGPAWPLTRVAGLAGIAGPLLILASSIIWAAGADEARYAVQFYGATFTALALLGLCAALAVRAPRASAVLAVFAVLGLGSGGAGFAVDGLHQVIFDSGSLADEGGLAGTLAPALPGLLGPLSLIGIGIALARTGVAKAWSGVALVAAGLLFPVSRIGEIPLLAVVVDLLIVAAVVPLAARMWRGRSLRDA